MRTSFATPPPPTSPRAWRSRWRPTRESKTRTPGRRSRPRRSARSTGRNSAGSLPPDAGPEGRVHPLQRLTGNARRLRRGCGSVLAAREAACGRDALAMRFGRLGNIFVGGRDDLAGRDNLTRWDDNLFLRRLVLEVDPGAQRSAEPRPPGRPRTAHPRPDSFRRCSTWSSPSPAPGRLAALAVFLDEPGLVLGDRLDRGRVRRTVGLPLVVEATVPALRRPLRLVLGSTHPLARSPRAVLNSWHACKTDHCGHPRKGIVLLGCPHDDHNLGG